MRSQVNMTWNDMPHHHIPKKSNHGVMNYIFVMACCDKITCREKNLSFYFSDFVNKKGLIPFTLMFIFVNYVCTRYVNAHIHQGLNPRPHGNRPRC